MRMERRGHNGNGFSYSNLFNLEPLMSYQLPQRDDDFESSGYSSQDESRGTLGRENVLDNGLAAAAYRSFQPSISRKRRRHISESEFGPLSSRRHELDSNDDDEEDYGNHISEEKYRTMLGEHVQKYRRMRFKESSGLAPTRVIAQAQKQNHGTKVRKIGNQPLYSFEEEKPVRSIANSPEYHSYDIASEYSAFRNPFSSMDSSYLDLGEGITYRIPPTYDKLAVSLRLPSFSDIEVEEHYLKGTLDLRSLAAMVASDRKFGARNQVGMGNSLPQYESLQARLKALSSCNSGQEFSLHVHDIALDSLGIPEGSAGKIRRLILSETGSLQVYFVKVLEKGDTYEIIERSLPKKQITEKDPSVIQKEEMEKIGKIWVNIARRDIPKHLRIFTNLNRKKQADARRCSETCQREVRMKVSRSLKLMRGASIRTRKLARDMLVFWKRVDKEQAEQRKKEEKEAAEALKREEELRETKRQQQRLNFLLSQTELYSHFMQNKQSSQDPETLFQSEGDVTVIDVSSVSTDKQNEEDAEEAELKREALKVAQHAVSQQKMLTSAFDSECLKLRQSVETEGLNNELPVRGSNNIDLLNPSTMPITSSVQTPHMFRGTLKEYQLKGLQWLVNCYEQGLNGILADEMGLGKTIQAMAFLAHLAEEKNIWGPFLVVAPASVLNNWVDEITRFCPDMKALPYWGAVNERAILRKNINPKRLYRRESGFHILITSYQLLVADEKYLRRVKWQYMVLDEAQAIKSSNSIRWKTLLCFNCRNRLLLTGTPIQNNMAELWALLHFIMPTLFDSHEQFNEWFSKGIENHAEHGGTLNEHQLNRLHAVLKPFMLRRVKKDVISEMTGKIEVTVQCNLSSRQQAFYQAIKNKISIAELIDASRGYLSEKKILNLMNIVIQLRKVCNHPELFERNEGSTYVYFADIPNSLLPPPFGELEVVHYAGGCNPIKYKVPKLIHRENFPHGAPHNLIERCFNIFLPENVYRSSLSCDKLTDSSGGNSDCFGFTRLMQLSAAEASFLMKASILERLLYHVMRWDRLLIDEIMDNFLESGDDYFLNENIDKEKARAVSRMLLLPTKSESSLLRRKLATGPNDAPFESLVASHQDRFMSNEKLLHSIYAFIPSVRAPPISAQCSDRNFSYQVVELLHNPWVKRLFLGFARTSEYNGPRKPPSPHHLIQEINKELPCTNPILESTYRIFGSSPPIRNFDPAKMLTESGKLQMLDILLKRLRSENHRVLLFVQMTKMMDIIEDYMNYRKYKYLRFDGSSSIGDRRDMVRDFQNRNDIFVFLLSTRAGGLGINLTAADTVVFYESDWNPTLDLQAMDRAHRLGQTKDVTVYRLICKDTVEEKILQRASQKNTVQQLVMTGGHVQDDLLRSEDVFSLLIDDVQLEQKLREIPFQGKDRQKKKRPSKGIRLDADGGAASLEDFPGPDNDSSVHELVSGQENGASTSKKRKSNPDLENSNKKKPLKPSVDTNDSVPADIGEDHNPHIRLKCVKKRSVNEDTVPVNFATDPAQLDIVDRSHESDDFETPQYEVGGDAGYPCQTPPT